MATLYKRASDRQRRIFRIIEGAVKNAADCHRNNRISDNFARSVAKRATGTLSAQLADVLASSPVTAPDRDGTIGTPAPSLRRPHCSQANERRRALPRKSPSPLTKLHFKIGRLAAKARGMGNHEAELAYIAILRLIADEIEKSGPTRR